MKLPKWLFLNQLDSRHISLKLGESVREFAGMALQTDKKYDLAKKRDYSQVPTLVNLSIPKQKFTKVGYH